MRKFWYKIIDKLHPFYDDDWEEIISCFDIDAARDIAIELDQLDDTKHIQILGTKIIIKNENNYIKNYSVTYSNGEYIVCLLKN